MRFSFLFFILICSFSFSQSKDIIIDWDGNKVFSISSAKFKVPYFSNYNFNFTPSKGISLVAQWIDNSGIDKNSRFICFKISRIFMFSCIAALALGGKWKIYDKKSINTSFPEFLKILRKLGANFS